MKLKWEGRRGWYWSGAFVIYEGVDYMWHVSVKGKPLQQALTLAEAKRIANDHARHAAVFGPRPVRVLR